MDSQALLGRPPVMKPLPPRKDVGRYKRESSGDVDVVSIPVLSFGRLGGYHDAKVSLPALPDWMDE